MIKIIKEGQTKFIGNCDTCGCQFSYELSDIVLNSVYCPCCGSCCAHKRLQVIPNTTEIAQEYSITTTDPRSAPISLTAKL